VCNLLRPALSGPAILVDSFERVGRRCVGSVAPHTTKDDWHSNIPQSSPIVSGELFTVCHKGRVASVLRLRSNAGLHGHM